MEPGAIASAVARAAGIYSSQLFRWRQQLCERTADGPEFAAVTIAAQAGLVGTPASSSAGVIEIDFAGGTRLRITGAVEAKVISAVLMALRKNVPQR